MANTHPDKDTATGEIVAGADGHTSPSYGLSNRLRRVAWHLVYLLLFRPTPRPLHAWRAVILRAFGAQLGHRVHVYPRVKIWAPWNLELHDESCLGDEVNCYSMAKITLGRRAIVSQGAHLCTGTHDYADPNFQLYALPIVIGERAWVCTEAFIGPGVTIGDRSVVGARAVVIKDMPEGMVCAGHPARPIKPRYRQSHDRGDDTQRDGGGGPLVP